MSRPLDSLQFRYAATLSDVASNGRFPGCMPDGRLGCRSAEPGPLQRRAGPPTVTGLARTRIDGRGRSDYRGPDLGRADEVEFGGPKRRRSRRRSSTTVFADGAPPLLVGVVDVTVMTPSGTSAVTSATYSATASN